MKTKILLLSMFLLPGVTFAQSGGLTGTDDTAAGVGNLIENLIIILNDYVTPFILGLAFLVFVWGVFKYFVLGGGDEEKQTEGKSLMIYGISAFVVMLCFYGLVQLISGAIGLGNQASPFSDFDSGIQQR